LFLFISPPPPARFGRRIVRDSCTYWVRIPTTHLVILGGGRRAGCVKYLRENKGRPTRATSRITARTVGCGPSRRAPKMLFLKQPGNPDGRRRPIYRAARGSRGGLGGSGCSETGIRRFVIASDEMMDGAHLLGARTFSRLRAGAEKQTTPSSMDSHQSPSTGLQSL